MSLKTVGGRFVSRAGELLSGLCACLCSNPLVTTCAACLGFGIPMKLNVTYTFAGFSKTVRLTNVSNDGVVAVWNADFSATGGTWVPCPGSGPRFNTAFAPDSLRCQCVDGECKLIYRFTIDQFDNGTGVNGLEYDEVLTDDPCEAFIHDMVLVSSDPLNLTFSHDLADSLVGDCGVGTIFDVEVTVP